MNYKTLNYLLKITAKYEQPKFDDKENFRVLLNKFLTLNFYPKIQEEQSFRFSMEEGKSEKALNQVVSFMSMDSQWLIHFPRDGVEVIYNGNLEGESKEINEEEFLTSAIEYINLLTESVQIEKYIRIGFVSNKYNDKSDAKYISSIFPEFNNENNNTLEMQNNIIIREEKDGLEFNVLKNRGYYKAGRINYIGGVKDFCGTTAMRDINTSLTDLKNINIENIIKTIQKIILGE